MPKPTKEVSTSPVYVETAVQVQAKVGEYLNQSGVPFEMKCDSSSNTTGQSRLSKLFGSAHDSFVSLVVQNVVENYVPDVHDGISASIEDFSTQETSRSATTGLSSLCDRFGSAHDSFFQHIVGSYVPEVRSDSQASNELEEFTLETSLLAHPM